MNLLLAIIVSALVGFVAGHFSSRVSDPQPVSLKEAVTGDVDAPAPQYNLPRPPSVPVMCEPGKTLQQQIAALNFAEVRKICNEAERDYRAKVIDAYVPFYDTRTTEGARAARDWIDHVREVLKQSNYWRGEVTVSRGERVIQILFFSNFRIESGEVVCSDFSPFFTLNGQALPNGTTGSCGGPLRRKAENFFFSWETFNDDDLSPVMSAVIVPVPGSSQADVEFLDSESGQWTRVPFRWASSSREEFDTEKARHERAAQ